MPQLVGICLPVRHIRRGEERVSSPQDRSAATATGPVGSAHNTVGSGAARAASSAPSALAAVPQTGGSPLPGWLQTIVNVVGI
jgi:hypothetical protein